MELTAVVVETFPFTEDEMMFPIELREFSSIGFMVVEATCPFTIVDRIISLVEVEIVMKLVVELATIVSNEVVAITPFIFEVKTVPETEKLLLVMIVVVPTLPPRFEVKIFEAFERRFAVWRFVRTAFCAKRLVVVASKEIILFVFKFSEAKFVVVAFVMVALVPLRFSIEASKKLEIEANKLLAFNEFIVVEDIVPVPRLNAFEFNESIFARFVFVVEAFVVEEFRV